MFFDKLEIHVKSVVFGVNGDVSGMNNNERGVNRDENKLNRNDISMNRYRFVGLSLSNYDILFTRLPKKGYVFLAYLAYTCVCKFLYVRRQ